MQLKYEENSFDCLSYLLELIVDFTNRRHELITYNIANINDNNFAPFEFPVQDFTKTIENAIVEYICSERLLLQDSELIKFGLDTTVEVVPSVDEKALELFRDDINGYMELQAEKLSENSVNNKVARELLKQRQQENTALNI